LLSLVVIAPSIAKEKKEKNPRKLAAAEDNIDGMSPHDIYQEFVVDAKSVEKVPRAGAPTNTENINIYRIISPIKLTPDRTIGSAEKKLLYRPTFVLRNDSKFWFHIQKVSDARFERLSNLAGVSVYADSANVSEELLEGNWSIVGTDLKVGEIGILRHVIESGKSALAFIKNVNSNDELLSGLPTYIVFTKN